MVVMGIDPGVKGAFALLGRDDLIVETMPLNQEGEIDFKELVRLISAYAGQTTYCFLEVASIRPGQAAQATVIRNCAVIEGILLAFGVKYTRVKPNDWSKEFDHGVTERDLKIRKKLIKVERRKIAETLYSGIDLKRTPNCKFSDEGIVDALLIATYGWRKHNQKLRGFR